MRVLMECGVSVSGKRGISVLQDHVIQELARFDKETEVLLFSYFYTNYDRMLREWFGDFPKQPNFKLLVKRWPERVVRAVEERLGFPLRRRYFEHIGIDVYHTFGWTHPILPRAKIVVTVQDTPFLHREFVPGYPWATETVAEQLRGADRVVAVSQTVKREITEAFGLEEEKIAVIPYGIDFDIFSPRERGALGWVRQKYGLPERYLLGMGPWAVRDNAETLLKAFSQVMGTPEYGRHQLVLVGGVDSGAPVDVDALISKLGLGGRVARVGHVPGQSPDLAGIYGLADVLVFLSSLEGIGLPPLEAMATGIPVVASNQSGVPEFVGDAGVLVNPRDADAVAAALLDVARSATLREANVRRGLKRVRQWTWERAARDTLAAWKQAHTGG